MPESKPPITGTTHHLPYNNLSDKQFEELCLWLVQREGYERAQHLGAAGSEQGRDIIAWRVGEQWAFQCKRVQSFSATTAEGEIKKLLKLPEEEIPRHYVFIACCQISAGARRRTIQQYGGQFELDFWAITELDEKVQKYPELVAQFFQIAVSSPTPHQIPAPPADFTGREGELAGLLEAQASGACISGLRGLGGVGKSALAFKLAAALAERYPDGQLFIDMRGTSDPALSPAQAMAQVIRVWHPVERLPEDEAELSKLYRSLLHGKRVLLLLDNAHDRAQVEPLLPHAGCFVLVTTRWRFALPGVKALDLEALSLDEAVQLLLAIEPRLNGAAARLAELCGCVPLALRVSASALAESPSLPVAEFLEKFAQARVQLSGMDASLRMSYDLLDPRLQAMLCRLSVFPAPFDRPAAAAVWELDEPTAQPALDALVNASLLEWDAATGFRQHDLVRAFADGLFSEAERYAAGLRHAEYYLEVARQAKELYKQGGDHVLQGLRLFDLHWAHLQAGQRWAAAKAEDDQAAARLCNEYPDAATYLLDLRLCPEQQIAWRQAALSAARRLGLKEAEAAHLGNLGAAYHSLDQVEQAIQHYQQALVIAREIGDRRGEGNALGNLGLSYADLGQVEQAIQHYQQALVIDREIGDLRGEGADLGNLGVAYHRLGQVEQAIQHYQQQLDITRAIGDRRGEGNALGNLGNAYADLGQVEQAIQHYQQALVIARAIGDRRNEGTWLGNLGNAYRDLGQVKQAIQHYQQALVIARETGDRRNEGAWLGNLGLVYADLGQVEQAIQHHQQALEVAREIGDRRGEGAHLGNLGVAYKNLGRMDEAIQHYQQALVIAREIGDRRGEGNRLGSLGLAYADLGQVEQAIQHYQQQLDITRAIGDRRGEGVALGNLAYTYESQGDLARAVRLAAAAQAIFSEIKSPSREQAAKLLAGLRKKLGKKKFQAALSAPGDLT